MLQRISIAWLCFAVFAGPSLAQNQDIDSTISELRASIARCEAERRDFCVVTAGTRMLTSLPAMERVYEVDPAALESVRKSFDDASLRLLSRGAPFVRKFIAENGLWVSDYYYDRFLSNKDADFNYSELIYEFSAYQLMRAQACDELANTACAASALWAVNNAIEEGKWEDSWVRFNPPSFEVATLLNGLMDRYKDDI